MFVVSRVSYAIEHGSIPKGMRVLHTCDNPSCVNPSHLWIGTQGDNMRDCAQKGRMAGLRGSANPSRQHPERLSRGEHHGNAKLTKNAVVEIREKYATGKYKQRELAKNYGVSQGAVFFVIHHINWAHIKE